MQRRSFLSWALRAKFALFGGWAFSGCDKSPQEQPSAPESASVPVASKPKTYLTAEEREKASAVLRRILPSDSGVQAPGADAIDAISFVDRQLAQEEFESMADVIRAGLKYLDAVSRRLNKTVFLQLSGSQQDGVLGLFQRGAVPGLRFPQEQFFTTLHTLALEAAWAQPKYGGNAERLSWKWAGIHPHCPHMHGSGQCQ